MKQLIRITLLLLASLHLASCNRGPVVEIPQTVEPRSAAKRQSLKSLDPAQPSQPATPQISKPAAEVQKLQIPVINKVAAKAKQPRATTSSKPKPIAPITPPPPVTTPTPPPQPLATPESPKPTKTPYSRLDQERLREQKLYFLQGDQKPFTGTAYKEFPNGNHSFEIDCVDGKAHGHLTQFYSNGQKQFQVPMQANRASGNATGWYSNGKKKSEYPYKDGVVHGTFTEWFKTGQQGLQANYVEGRLRGKIHGWYLDGTPYSIGEIQSDESDRISAWYEPGSKWKEIGYRNGKLWGYYMDWDQNGKLLSVKRYKDGKLLKAIK